MLGNYFEYPAACTRARGVRAKLLSEKEWADISRAADLYSALNILLETEYRNFFDWTTLHADALPSLRRVEHNLRSSTIAYVINILRFLSGAPADVPATLIQKYDLLNIKKTVRRLNHPRLQETHLKIDNYQLGRYSLCPKVDWDNIKTLDELSEILKSTYYQYAYQKSYNTLSESNNLMLFECQLEKVYYDVLISAAEKLDKSKSESTRALLAYYFDEVSLSTFVRLKYDHDLDFPAILPLLPLRGCRFFSERLLEKLNQSSDSDDFFQLLAEDSNCSKIAGSDLKSTICNIRQKRKKHCAKVFAEGLSMSVAPVVAFFFLKEQETDDLISILQCKRFGVEVSNNVMCVNF